MLYKLSKNPVNKGCSIIIRTILLSKFNCFVNSNINWYIIII